MVSSTGRVLSSQGTCTQGALNPCGYRVVGINGTTHRVHRLVLCSFTQALPSFSWVVNHIDGNKQNNFLENLEFATPAQNAEHAVRTHLRKPSLQHTPVLGRPLCSKEWIHFESQMAAAVHLRCTASSISRVCNCRAKSVKGWEFHYEEDTSLQGEHWAPVVLELPPG
mmetsp:Transcript_62904/g.116947  ORF Transcript_62904/g.116947 Transcript_62904/m.116947 type:complete len:168 (+) Transcript_62904:539-1042(+)